MNIISSLHNDSTGNFLVWKCPVEDFNDNSILTVQPGEEGLLINNGMFMQAFMNGRYQLNTQNFPFLNYVRNKLSNGVSTFHCSIYFVSTVQTAEIFIGTSMQMRDPVQNISTKLFVRGSYTVTVENSAEFLLNLISLHVNYLAADDLKIYFGNQIQQKIISEIYKYEQENHEELLSLGSKLNEISAAISNNVGVMISKYGLRLNNFSLSALEVADDDPNRQLLEAAYARNREREIYGQQYDSTNNDNTRSRVNNQQNDAAYVKPDVSNEMEYTKVDDNQASQHMKSGRNEMAFDVKLLQLKSMLDKNLITQDEYNAVKTEILKKMI